MKKHYSVKVDGKTSKSFDFFFEAEAHYNKLVKKYGSDRSVTVVDNDCGIQVIMHW